MPLSLAIISQLIAFMNHRQELILKRDLLEKKAGCIEKEGTQMEKKKPNQKQQPKPPKQLVYYKTALETSCFGGFFSSQTALFTNCALCQINLDYKGETSATVNSVSA